MSASNTTFTCPESQELCGGKCYNAATYICVNGTVCLPWQDVCLVNRPEDYGYPLSPLQCYDPWSSKCIDGVLCSNGRICDGKCITEDNAYYQVCANNKRTVCNVTSSHSSYRPYQMHLCNGQCFDTSLQQCINGSISCIDDSCHNQCYHSASGVCLNNTLCPVGSDLCEVKYDSSSGSLIEPPLLRCYNPRSERCLNYTVCYKRGRVCNGQCILNNAFYQYQVCASDQRTLCDTSRPYISYQPNQIQVCNGTCIDTENPPVRRCVNDAEECILNCSGACYHSSYKICISGTLCNIGDALCQGGSRSACYNPRYDRCLNGIVCSNSRACGEQCLRNDYQVCANDHKTICNVNRTYNYYVPYQMQLCRGVCYDSALQQCSGNPTDSCVRDPATQECLPENTSSSTTATATVSSNATVNDASAYPATNNSDLSTITGPLHSSIGASAAETTQNSITPFETVDITSSSIPSQPPTPWTDHAQFSYSSSSDGTTAALELSSNTDKTSLDWNIASVDTNTLSTSSDTTPTQPFPSLSIDDTSRVSVTSDMTSSASSPSEETDLSWISSNTISSPKSSSSSLGHTNAHSILSETSSSSISLSSVSETTGIQSVALAMTSFSISPSPSFETTNLISASPDTSSFAISSNPSSVSNSESTSIASSATAHTESAALTTETETPSRPLSHLPTSSPRTSEAPCGTTSSITAPFPDQTSCCPRSAYTNDTGSCTPRVECRCYGNTQKRDNNQACRAIVIGGNNNNSLVVAIAVNDKKVIIINNTHFLLLLVCAGITLLLLLLLAIGSLVVVYHKGIRITLRLWYLSIKNFKAEAQRKEWEKR